MSNANNPVGINSKLTPVAFTLRAIERLEGKKKQFPYGIHVVYSGFNDAYRAEFPGRDPIVDVNAMEVQGKVEKRLVRGGAVIYRPGTAPARKTTVAQDALNAIIGDGPAPRKIELE